VDRSTFGGIVIAVLGIGCGLMLEAAVGSSHSANRCVDVIGARWSVMVQFPLPVVLQAFIHSRTCSSSGTESDALVQNLLRYAYKARKEGLLSLDTELARIQTFLKEA